MRLAEAWHDVEKHVQITWQVTSDPSEPFLPPLFVLTLSHSLTGRSCRI